MTGTDKIYPLAPVDDVLEKIGLPKTKTILEKVSPQNVLGNKLGITPPGEVVEGIVDEIDSSVTGGRLPLPDLPIRR